jgi:hypothetical protein
MAGPARGISPNGVELLLVLARVDEPSRFFRVWPPCARIVNGKLFVDHVDGRVTNDGPCRCREQESA